VQINVAQKTGQSSLKVFTLRAS